MCYIEYIGYDCGHTSVAVLRVCPLTTQLPTNPVCPRSAHRPTPGSGVCPACARVLHTRWVDLVMFEHQWMHERGTCACPVRFPQLQQPRAIGGPEPAAVVDGQQQQQKDPSGGPPDFAGASSDAALRAISTRMAEAVRARSSSSNNSIAAREETVRADDTAGEAPPPLKGPATTSSWNGIAPLWEVDESAEVRVRLSSQYAAEWVLDHGQRHRDGSCACPVRFEQYTPHRVTEDDVAADAVQQQQQQHDKKAHNTNSKPKTTTRGRRARNRGRFKRKTSEAAAAATAAVPAPVHDAAGPPVSHLMRETLRLSDVLAWNVLEKSDSPDRLWSAWPTRPEDYGFKTIDEAENALTGEGPVVPKLAHLSDKPFAPAFFHQGEPPIVGWPIGAGPEGGVENSHSPAWHMCDLSRPRLRRSRSSEW